MVRSPSLEGAEVRRSGPGPDSAATLSVPEFSLDGVIVTGATAGKSSQGEDGKQGKGQDV